VTALHSLIPRVQTARCLPGHRTSQPAVQYAPDLIEQEYADDDSPMGNPSSPSSVVGVGCDGPAGPVSRLAPAQAAMTLAITTATLHGTLRDGGFAD